MSHPTLHKREAFHGIVKSHAGEGHILTGTKRPLPFELGKPLVDGFTNISVGFKGSVWPPKPARIPRKLPIKAR